MFTFTARRAAVAGAVFSSLALTATPAAAAAPDTWSSRTSGQAVEIEWTQDNRVSGDPLPGNYHIGSIRAEKGSFGTYAYGWIDDFECAPGELPWGHEEESGCEYLGTRKVEGDEDLVVTIDKRLSRGTISGTLLVGGSGHDGHEEEPEPEVPGTPVPIKITVTGSGDTYRSTEVWREQGPDGDYSSSMRTISRGGTVSGSMGRMPFDPAASSARLLSFTERSRWVS